MFSYYVGMMSGTSLDAVDAVLVRFDDDAEQLTRIAAYSLPLPTELRKLLTHLAHATQLTFKDLAIAEDGITRCYAECANQLLSKIDDDRQPVALGCHGQTIEHQPNSTPPYTLQLLNPSLLAELTGQNVICDFRRRDLAAGGQAAPLAPAFHQAALQSKDEDRIIINLGGIANLTYLPADQKKPVIGFDTGPANLLLDAWHQQHWQSDYDVSGQRASGGRVIPELLQQLCSDEYFARLPPKSTGREYFNPQWLHAQLAACDQQNLLPEDVLATLTELTAVTLTDQVKYLDPTNQAQLLICGGGWFNTFLVSRIRVLSSPRKVTSTEDAGIPPQDMEAIAFAWLAKQHVSRLQGNLPSVTGAKEGRVLGGFYPA
jgi:anhydro-N-acetylmuramic acid kinase